ncbi:MAG: heparan-alpha-glucosaminide N-acetyltransferase domain-containing protein [Desulfitobacteriaceae bacterium]
MFSASDGVANLGDVALKDRMPFIDQTRGLIMLFMALDHALYFWSYGRISNEGLPFIVQGNLTFNGANGASVLAYLVMLLSSICAPGFFFIAGYVLALSVKHREEAGVPNFEINKHLALRGIGLIALQVLVASPAFNLPAIVGGIETNILSPGFLLSLSVLSTIGLGFFFLILARHLSPWKLVGLSASLYMLGEIVLPKFAVIYPQLSLVEKGLQNLLVLPVPFSSQYLLNSNFPLIPWLVPLSLGWLYGHTFSPENGIQFEGKRFFFSGLASLGVFFFLRLQGLGDYLKAGNSFSGFFVLSKYPPSPDYFLFYLGLVFILFFLFIQLPKQRTICRILEGFGRAPLFFYNTHLWVYALIPALFNRFNRLSLLEGLGVWLLGLFILYPMMRWSMQLRTLKGNLKPRQI